ncbi:hypothetical protein V8E52_009107 [Russula decolorans]
MLSSSEIVVTGNILCLLFGFLFWTAPHATYGDSPLRSGRSCQSSEHLLGLVHPASERYVQRITNNWTIPAVDNPRFFSKLPISPNQVDLALEQHTSGMVSMDANVRLRHKPSFAKRFRFLQVSKERATRAPSSYTTSFPWARVVECETWGERGIGGSVAILAGDDRMGSSFRLLSSLSPAIESPIRLGHVPSFGSFTRVLARSSTLQRIPVPSEDTHIVIANPLMNENRQECCQKTRDEAMGQKAFTRTPDGTGFKAGGLAEWKNRNLWRKEE